MNQIRKHRTVMVDVLKDFYQHPVLASQIGFKGGTSLYLFHELDRFSVDLDFNLLVKETDFNIDLVTSVLEKRMKIKDQAKKYNTLFWLGSYEEKRWNLKVEISSRDFNDQYEILSLYGLSIPVMKLSYQFAHKLVAITDRKVMVSRDLFDVWWMFNKNIDIAEEVVKKRTGMTVNEYINNLIDFIPKNVNTAGLLYGMGELLDSKQKAWVKDKLMDELLFYLKAYLKV